MIRGLLKKLVDQNKNLSYYEVSACMREIMEGKTEDTSIANFLLALKMKGESVEELKAMLDVMNEFSIKINPTVTGRLVDTCGTGGDKVKTFNISTAAAFVAAGAGVNIAKHGNRSVSGVSGSADVLEYFGYDLNIDTSKVQKCIQELGLGFMFAPRFHPSMKNVASARKQIGIRTAFNMLGPLSNPAKIDAQTVGVSDNDSIDKIVKLLQSIGREEAMVFHARDGLDELSNTCMNDIAWLKNDQIDKFELNPKDFKITTAEPAELSVMDKEASAQHTFMVLNGTASAKRTDIVLLNAAAAIIVANKADSFEEAIELARQAILSGEAYKKLKSLIKICGNVSVLEECEKNWQNS